MKEIIGKFNTAKVYTDNVEVTAVDQIQDICNMPEFSDSNIRIMPDVHAGAGCTIGTTMTLHGKVVPSFVGVDIGCTVSAYKILSKEIPDLDKLDKFIRESIPSSYNCRKVPLDIAKLFPFDKLVCKNDINLSRAICSIGTLGGGNHFIEVDQDDEGFYWLVIHTGSRNLGTCVEKYHENVANRPLDQTEKKAEIIDRLKREGREKEIGQELGKLKNENVQGKYKVLSGKAFDDYIHDMKITQEYALLNHDCIFTEIVNHMNWDITECITTSHNYIDMDSMILRKGAVSAKEGQLLLIPLNMRDGTLICKGKGNPDWNYSAPHGAGRLMSRSQARKQLNMEQFKNSMEGIKSSTVCVDTIDEAPMAYKPFEEIISYIEPTAEIIGRMKPVYNFKAAE